MVKKVLIISTSLQGGSNSERHWLWQTTRCQIRPGLHMIRRDCGIIIPTMDCCICIPRTGNRKAGGSRCSGTKSRIRWRQAVVNVVRESFCECWEKVAMQCMIILRISPGRCDLFHRKSMAAGGLGSARTERHTEHLPHWCQCGEQWLFSHQRENRQWKVPQRC